MIFPVDAVKRFLGKSLANFKNMAQPIKIMMDIAIPYEKAIACLRDEGGG
jgi:hypothetical protein